MYVKFTAQKKTFKVPFYLICDLESFLTPTDDDDDRDNRNTLVIDEHKVSGFACYRVTDFDQYRTDPYVYSGERVMEEFYNHVIAESSAIAAIIGATVPMLPLTRQQKLEYDQATACGNCNIPFSSSNRKIRHHCHVSGKYLFPACNNCNLQLKLTKSRRRKRNDDGRMDYVDNYFFANYISKFKRVRRSFRRQAFQKRIHGTHQPTRRNSI